MPLGRPAQLLLAPLLVGSILAACARTEPDARSAAGPPATYFGHLSTVDPVAGRLDLDLVGRRSGADTAPEAGEASWPVAADARAEVVECDEVCATVAVPVAALADGAGQPRSRPDALFEVVVEGDVVVSIAERPLR